ncbi:hypothetical protein ACFL6U_30735, partial [Planctomycetota bacterium]
MFGKQKTTLLVLVLAFAGSSVKADFVFGEPVMLGPSVNTSHGAFFTSISADGLELYFCSDRPGGSGDSDVWVTIRATKDETWGEPTNLGSQVNSSTFDGSPSLSGDGLTLYFDSLRGGGHGNGDIWVTRRATKSGAWGSAVNLGPPVNTSGDEGFPVISSDGLELYFGDFSPVLPGGVGKRDLWMSQRPTVSDPWDPPQNLGPTINSTDHDEMPGMSADGLILLVTARRPGGYGGRDIWFARRASINDPWTELVNAGPSINTSRYDQSATISADGSTLYFSSNRSGSSLNLWQASINPLVDFNGDRQVDCIDICDLVAQWGTDNSLYDIGPMPWGDGIVDEKD